MARKAKSANLAARTILLVDDNVEYLQMIRLVLEREGHRVLCAGDGESALSLLREQLIDLVLIDYHMPGMTGEQVITELRKFNDQVQIILQTGYASEQPPMELLRRLDIQGYYDKSDGPEKLLLWTEVGLKAAHAVQLLRKTRQGIRHLLEVAPDLHRIRPLQDLLQGVLFQLTGLLSATDSFIGVLRDGGADSGALAESFLALLNEAELPSRIMCVGTGRFLGPASLRGTLTPDELLILRNALDQGEIQTSTAATAIPLKIGSRSFGTIFLAQRVTIPEDLDLLSIFANQSALAIQNVLLSELAAHDSLTGLYVRRFFEQWLLQEVRTAFRNDLPLALLMLDMDNLKTINDRHGNQAGDSVLAGLGQALIRSTRAGDISARYGGDEFAIIMPNTTIAGAQQAARRIVNAAAAIKVRGVELQVPVSCSIGLSVLAPRAESTANLTGPIALSFFERAANSLVDSAHSALCAAKQEGRSLVKLGSEVVWP